MELAGGWSGGGAQASVTHCSFHYWGSLVALPQDQETKAMWFSGSPNWRQDGSEKARAKVLGLLGKGVTGQHPGNCPTVFY